MSNLRLDGETAYRAYMNAIGTGLKWEVQTEYIKTCWSLVERAVAQKLVVEAKRRKRVRYSKWDKETNQWIEEGMNGNTYY